MTNRTRHRLTLFFPLILLVACTESKFEAPKDATPDVTHDVTPDIMTDIAKPYDADEQDAVFDAPEEGAPLPTNCDSERGPSMVEVSTPDGQRYCIDSTEVTQSQYKSFLESVSMTPGSEHERCAFNDTYKPHIATSTTAPGGDCHQDRWTPVVTPDRPVICIDWCDAMAFCKWAGKRLCGRVGGGEVGQDERNDPNVSQWFNVCSQGGTTVYPYGDEFVPSACSGAAFTTDGGTTAPDSSVPLHSPSDVGTWPACRGTTDPWSMVYDLGGNVREWTDSCQLDSSSGSERWYCATRGGYFLWTEPSYYACDHVSLSSIQLWRSSQGFRCCRDLPES